MEAARRKKGVETGKRSQDQRKKGYGIEEGNRMEVVGYKKDCEVGERSKREERFKVEERLRSRKKVVG
jgi:hypothetical protein